MNRDIVVLGSLNIDFVVRASRRPEKVRLSRAKSFRFFREERAQTRQQQRQNLEAM